MPKNIYEKIKHLSQLLDRNKRNPHPNTADQKVVETDLLWDSSRFWADVIHQAELISHCERTEADFKLFTAQYDADTGVKTNVDDLFDRGWLRNILGKVHTASCIRKALQHFDEILNFYNELKFVVEFYKSRARRRNLLVDKEEVEQAITEYQTQHSVTLKTDGVYYYRWSSVKNAQINFSSMDVHFEPYIVYWDDFTFLHEWKKKASTRREKGMRLSKNAFYNIYSLYNHYPNLPTVEDFSKQKVLQEDEDNFIFSFHKSECHYWSALADKISGLYWEKLVQGTAQSSDAYNIRLWLRNILYWEQTPNHLTYASHAAKERFLNASYQLLSEATDLIGITNEYQK